LIIRHVPERIVQKLKKSKFIAARQLIEYEQWLLYVLTILKPSKPLKPLTSNVSRYSIANDKQWIYELLLV